MIPYNVNSILTKEQLEKDYEELGSLTKIAEKYGTSDTPIRARFVKYNIPFKSKVQNNICNHDIFSEDSEKSFYLAGFIAADGCIRISKTNKKSDYLNYRLAITLSKKDEDFLYFIRELLGSDKLISEYTNKISKYNANWNDAECVSLYITSKQMVNDLKRFGIGPRKSLNLEFPQWLIEHPLVSHFIRGYIDGDGCFYIDKRKQKQYICTSIRGSEPFLKNIKYVLDNYCGIYEAKRIQINKINGIGQLNYSSSAITQRIFDFIYNDATIFMPRKYEIAKLSYMNLPIRSFKRWQLSNPLNFEEFINIHSDRIEVMTKRSDESLEDIKL